jgi:hypothetical protein
LPSTLRNAFHIKEEKMEWSTVIFLGLGMLSLVAMMGIIIFGTKKSSEMKAIEKMVAKKVRIMDTSANELQKALQESEEEKDQMLQRLQNLEAIVTSEIWESANADNSTNKIELDLNIADDEVLNNELKAANLAKKLR